MWLSLILSPRRVGRLVRCLPWTDAWVLVQGNTSSLILNRSHHLSQLDYFRRTPCDVLVIGGGATGLCCALDAVLRGYRTVLLEAHDFAKGTSSRSTKIIHGGVRYLRQGQVGLVRQSLQERGLWLQRAPSLVKPQTFAIPCSNRFSRAYYAVGLKAYDFLSGRRGLAPSRPLKETEMAQRFANFPTRGYGVLYEDAQFDDARLAVELAKAAGQEGAVILNHLAVRGFKKTGPKITGVLAEDTLTGKEFDVDARVVINAAGVFSGQVRNLPGSGESVETAITPSQGIHFVLPKDFLPGETALMIPKTDDGRVLFAIPWHGRVLFGTTDTPRDEISIEPQPLAEEIEYLLHHGDRCFLRPPSREDILSVFAGLRPLVTPSGSGRRTASISRDHQVTVSESGMISVTGGKWTTARHMAEDTMDTAIAAGELRPAPCVTREFPLSSSLPPEAMDTPTPEIITHAVENEMAMTVEDVLARRTRLLFLDAKKSLEAVPMVARTMAALLDKDSEWIRSQENEFGELAAGYLP